MASVMFFERRRLSDTVGVCSVNCFNFDLPSGNACSLSEEVFRKSVAVLAKYVSALLLGFVCNVFTSTLFNVSSSSHLYFLLTAHGCSLFLPVTASRANSLSLIADKSMSFSSASLLSSHAVSYTHLTLPTTPYV
eukprot:TRINITY_DN12537_c0_g4_i1.p1 TRINITY_DN12537_c0_g4~~TRINITY_DN12537_c0_g4_i1.p1  ORF type:complete len:135 (+),score=2.59 TRINITY_DN12537_c0_g4_i1:284-688(+)